MLYLLTAVFDINELVEDHLSYLDETQKKLILKYVGKYKSCLSVCEKTLPVVEFLNAFYLKI